MTTKQELERTVESLQSDVATLQAALIEIFQAAMSPDYTVSPALDKSPAYLLGRIQSLARCTTWRLSDSLGNTAFAGKLSELVNAQ